MLKESRNRLQKGIESAESLASLMQRRVRGIETMRDKGLCSVEEHELTSPPLSGNCPGS